MTEIIKRKINQIANQTIFQIVVNTLKENDIDFVINDGHVGKILSKKIASLTCPIAGPQEEYMCCDLSFYIFNIELPDTNYDYPSDHIKKLYLDWSPKTVNNGKKIIDILNEDQSIYADTDDYRLIRVELQKFE